ncbi:hypothetical protein GRX66_18465, partial [Halobacterium sp. PCN9]|nr:hypothetical protein [Halobacterium bonnevillei]
SSPDSASCRRPGDALGAFTALGGLGTAIGSVLGGVLAARTSYLVAFGVAGAFVFAGGALAVAARRRALAVPTPTDDAEL